MSIILERLKNLDRAIRRTTHQPDQPAMDQHQQQLADLQQMAFGRAEGRRTDTITVRAQENYGARVFYPVCEQAQLFARIAGTKTLTGSTMSLVKALGYRIYCEPTFGGYL